MAGHAYVGQPLVLDLGAEAWQEQLDAAEKWFGNVLVVITALHKLAEDCVDKLEEPHLRSYVRDLAELTAQHQDKAEQLHALIGRTPSSARKLTGTAVAKGRQAYGDVMDSLGGGTGGWRDLHRLVLACVNAMSAFSVAEQLGLALGLPEVVEVAFPVVHELATAQLLLQEFVLEMAPPSILYANRI